MGTVHELSLDTVRRAVHARSAVAPPPAIRARPGSGLAHPFDRPLHDRRRMKDVFEFDDDSEIRELASWLDLELGRPD